MNNDTKSASTSIRKRLILLLLIGLPLLFLLISIAVSVPLYKQIIQKEDEGMRQFARYMLNAGLLSSQKKPIAINEKTRETEYIFDNAPDNLEHMLFADEYDFVLWDKSGKLLESSLAYEAVLENGATVAKHVSNTVTPFVYKPKAQGFSNSGNVLNLDAWRLYYLTNPKTGETILVVQSWQTRLASIKAFVWDQMLLLLLNLPLLVILVVWAVHRGLRPLHSLANAVHKRHANELTPIQQDVPKELLPLTNALNQLFMRVSASLEKEKRFTADAAHELRSPITAIKLQATELQYLLAQNSSQSNDHGVDKLASLQAAQRIQRITERASHLIEQLLTLTKLDNQLDATETALEKQSINWLEVSEQALQSVSLTAREHGVTLKRHMHAKNTAAILPLADTQGGNSILLTLMLRNLLSNAICYGAGCDKVALKQVELTLSDNHISIRDYGNGIAPEYLERVKERFFRPAGQAQRGSGLGLSIVDRIAQLHGLNIAIDNHADGGVLVVISQQGAVTDILKC